MKESRREVGIEGGGEGGASKRKVAPVQEKRATVASRMERGVVIAAKGGGVEGNRRVEGGVGSMLDGRMRFCSWNWGRGINL